MNSQAMLYALAHKWSFPICAYTRNPIVTSKCSWIAVHLWAMNIWGWENLKHIGLYGRLLQTPTGGEDENHAQCNGRLTTSAATNKIVWGRWWKDLQNNRFVVRAMGLKESNSFNKTLPIVLNKVSVQSKKKKNENATDSWSDHLDHLLLMVQSSQHQRSSTAVVFVFVWWHCSGFGGP